MLVLMAFGCSHLREYELSSNAVFGDEYTKQMVVIMLDTQTQRSDAVRLIELVGSEYKLDKGRFSKYDQAVYDNEVVIRELSFQDLKQAFANMVEWLACTAKDSWNFFLSADKFLMTYQLRFYFRDPVDSMLFRLSIEE